MLRMEEETQNFSINISTRKSEIMVIGRHEEDIHLEDIVIRGQELKLVDKFVYLSSTITSDGRQTEDIERRKMGAVRAFEVLKKKPMVKTRSNT